jgi:hypothetical protein
MLTRLIATLAVLALAAAAPAFAQSKKGGLAK